MSALLFMDPLIYARPVEVVTTAGPDDWLVSAFGRTPLIMAAFGAQFA